MSQEERKKLNFKFYNTISKINYDEETLFNNKNSKKEIKIYYIWGPHCAGKSDLVYSLFNDNKYYNDVYYRAGFWSGVSNKTHIAVYDNFENSN